MDARFPNWNASSYTLNIQFLLQQHDQLDDLQRGYPQGGGASSLPRAPSWRSTRYTSRVTSAVCSDVPIPASVEKNQDSFPEGAVNSSAISRTSTERG